MSMRDLVRRPGGWHENCSVLQYTTALASADAWKARRLLLWQAAGGALMGTRRGWPDDPVC
jgi:hypothetical protein